MLNILRFFNPFTYIPVLGIVDPCSLDEIITGSKCINKQLAENEKLAASVYYLCQELAACDSGTCTLDELQEEARCFADQPPNHLVGFQVYADYLAASAAGASVDGSMEEIQEGIKCLRLADPILLQALIVVLRCKLRQCVTEPIIT